MNKRRPSKVIYIGVLAVIVAVLSVITVTRSAPIPTSNLWLFAALVVLTLIVEQIPVALLSSRGTTAQFTLSTAVSIPLAILFSPAFALLLTFVVVVVQELRFNRRPIVKVANILLTPLDASSSIIAVTLLLSPTSSTLRIWVVITSVVMVEGVLSWTALVTGDTCIDGLPFWSQLFSITFLHMTIPFLFISLVATLIVALSGSSPILLVPSAILIGIAINAMARRVTTSNQAQQLEFLMSLTEALQIVRTPDDARQLIESRTRTGLESPDTVFRDSPDPHQPSILFPGFVERPYLVLGQRSGAFEPSELQMLENLAAVNATILRNIELRTEIENQARHDALTGLWNRRGFFEIVNQELSRATRSGDLAAICYLDLDNFKPINDNYGHLIGDQFLVALSKRIRGSIRAGDIIGRLGGDEFVILLTNIQNEHVAEDIANEILRRINAPVSIDGLDLTCSASIGVTIVPPGDTSLDVYLALADTALYEAKKSGRNRVQKAS